MAFTQFKNLGEVVKMYDLTGVQQNFQKTIKKGLGNS